MVTVVVLVADASAGAAEVGDADSGALEASDEGGVDEGALLAGGAGGAGSVVSGCAVRLAALI